MGETFFPRLLPEAWPLFAGGWWDQFAWAATASLMAAPPRAVIQYDGRSPGYTGW